MKTTIVPAQVTTVEDKVAGNLSFTQLLLLITPLFLGGGIFVLLPPVFGFNYLKLLICSILAVICMTLAVRIKGKILLQWIVVLARYNSRPRLYLFNKNDSYLRQLSEKLEITEANQADGKYEVVAEPVIELLSVHQLVQAEEAISDPNRKFHLKSVKGGLRVVITEAEK
jgi:hypothetical protein